MKSILLWDGEASLAAEFDGKPVGFISCIRFDDRYAMIGFYIVLPGFRRKGIGSYKNFEACNKKFLFNLVYV